MTPGFASPGPTINATASLPSRRLGQGQWKATKPCPQWRARYRWVDRSTTCGIRSIRNLSKGQPDVPRGLPSTSQQHLRCIASDSARRGRRLRGRATPRAGMGCAQPVGHDAAIPPRTTSQEPEPEPDAQHGSRIAPGRGRGGRRRTRHGRAAAVFTQTAPCEALPGRLQAKRVGSVFPATLPQPGQLADSSRPARLRRVFRRAGAGPVRPRPAAQGPASTDDCDKRINWYVSPSSRPSVSRLTPACPRNRTLRDERRGSGNQRPGVTLAGVCGRRHLHVLHLPGSRGAGRRVPHCRILFFVGDALLGRVVGVRPRLEVSPHSRPSD